MSQDIQSPTELAISLYSPTRYLYLKNDLSFIQIVAAIYYIYIYRMALYGNCANKAKIVSEYDQEIPQSQTSDNPVAPRGYPQPPNHFNHNL